MNAPDVNMAFNQRAPLIEAIRRNLNYVHINGGNEHYTYQKIGEALRKVAPQLCWDKREVKSFLDGDFCAKKLDIATVNNVLRLSQDMYRRVASQIELGQSLLQQNTLIPLTQLYLSA